MGWGRTLLLGDIGNRLDIEDAEQDIASLKQKIDGSIRTDWSQNKQIEALVAENAELKLYLASVVRLLVSKGAISTDELRSMVDVVDAEDGSSDGKYEGEMT